MPQLGWPKKRTPQQLNFNYGWYTYPTSNATGGTLANQNIIYTPTSNTTTTGITYNNAAANSWYVWDQGSPPDTQVIITNLQAPQGLGEFLEAGQQAMADIHQQIDTIWASWNVVVQQSQEELEAIRRRAAEVTKAKEIANQNAERLLLAHLTPQQREQYQQHRYFEVFTAHGRKVRRYRIHHGWAGNIQVFEDDRHVENLCIHPTQTVPHADNLLAQKLMLEADEKQFLKTANHHPAAAIRLAA